MGKSKNTGGGTLLKEFAVHCGVAVAVAAGLTMALLAGLAALRTRVDLPFSFNQLASTIIVAISTLAATWIVGRKRKKTGLAFGAAAGLGVFVLLALISAIALGSEVSEQIFTKIIALVSAGALGGLLGVSRAGRSKRKKIKNK